MNQVADNLRGFLARVDEAKYKVGEDPVAGEFQEIKIRSAAFKQDNNYSTEEGGKPENLKKNRYKDILPYDHTRVPVSFLVEDGDSDYINASFIQGVDEQPRYIATQGPLRHTVLDFWRMIWQNHVKVIVMACREVEQGKKKCERYWPLDEETVQYGAFTVTTVARVIVNPEVVFRNLRVMYQEEARELGHFQYIAWPDRGIPDSYSCFLEMIQLVRQHQGLHSAPICVHCSAGCGRTGVICTVEYIQCLLHKQKVPSDFSIFEVVMKMRRQRPSAVQTKVSENQTLCRLLQGLEEQYDFLYHAVTEMFEKQLKDLNCNYENLNENKKPYYDDVASLMKDPRGQTRQRKEISSCMSFPLEHADMNDTYAVVSKKVSAPGISSGSPPGTLDTRPAPPSRHEYDNIKPRTMPSKPLDQLYSTVAPKSNRASACPTTSPVSSPMSSSYALAGASGPSEVMPNEHNQVNISSTAVLKMSSPSKTKDNRWSLQPPNSYAVVSTERPAPLLDNYEDVSDPSKRAQPTLSGGIGFNCRIGKPKGPRDPPAEWVR